MKMKANTVKTRTHSLLNQGLFYFDCLLDMREERARPLMKRIDELLRQHATTRASALARISPGSLPRSDPGARGVTDASAPS